MTMARARVALLAGLMVASLPAGAVRGGAQVEPTAFDLVAGWLTGPVHAEARARLAVAEGAVWALASPPATDATPLGDALVRLAEARGLAGERHVLATFAAAADRTPRLAEALARAVEAFLAFDAAARAAPHPAIAATDVLGLLVAPDLPAALGQLPPRMGPDPSTVDARWELVAALGHVARVVAATPAGLRSGLILAAAPAVGLDLEGVDSVWTQDVALLLDAGGDDVYLNNAGGSTASQPEILPCPLEPRGAAALLDLGGDDAYVSTRSCGINGGGYAGAGLLLDLEGADRYVAGGLGVNGGGFLGSGMLLDLGDAPDAYVSRVMVGATSAALGGNGAAVYGDGLLLDAGGADRYEAGVLSANGGSVAGVGAVLDLGEGNDAYIVEAQPALGVPGPASIAANGGSLLGGGLLLDAGGDDTYAAGGGGTNGGGLLGAGALLDLGGDDTYTGGDAGSNGGSASGVGLLVDLAGDDRYVAGTLGVLGEAVMLSGCLQAPCIVQHPFPAAALLFDADGTDAYTDANGTVLDASVFPNGIAGARLDLPVQGPVGMWVPAFTAGAGTFQGTFAVAQCVNEVGCAWLYLLEVGDDGLRPPIACLSLRTIYRCEAPLGYAPLAEVPGPLRADLEVGPFQGAIDPEATAAGLHGSAALQVATPLGTHRVEVPVAVG